MNNLNCIVVSGLVTADASPVETKMKKQDGSPVLEVRFQLAVSRDFTSAQRQQRAQGQQVNPDADFLQVRLRRNLTLAKSTRLIVKGEMRHDSVKNTDGTWADYYYILADDIQFLTPQTQAHTPANANAVVPGGNASMPMPNNVGQGNAGNYVGNNNAGQPGNANGYSNTSMPMPSGAGYGNNNAGQGNAGNYAGNNNAGQPGNANGYGNTSMPMPNGAGYGNNNATQGNAGNYAGNNNAGQPGNGYGNVSMPMPNGAGYGNNNAGQGNAMNTPEMPFMPEGDFGAASIPGFTGSENLPFN